MSLYEIPITKLSGIGEKRASLFRKLGINTVGDMVAYYPRIINVIENRRVGDTRHKRKATFYSSLVRDVRVDIVFFER